MSDYEKELIEFRKKIVTANDMVKSLEESNHILRMSKERLDQLNELFSKIEDTNQNLTDALEKKYFELVTNTENKWKEQVNLISKKVNEIEKLNLKLESSVLKSVENFETQTKKHHNNISKNLDNQIQELKSIGLIKIDAVLEKQNELKAYEEEKYNEITVLISKYNRKFTYLFILVLLFISSLLISIFF